jgi:SNF2 family DNA or RNA helicase
MIAPIEVRHVSEKNLFEVTCPPWLNDVARNLPNRRWHGKDRVWRAPAIRANARYLLNLVSDGRIAVSREVQLALSKALEPPAPIRQEFPSWYKFKTTPRPYQVQALHFMWSRPQGGLFMDMGTGKTKTWIDYACAMRMADKLDAGVIVCPVSIRDQWVEEVGLHSPLPMDICILNHEGYNFQRWFDHEHDFPLLICGIESLSAGNAWKDLARFVNAYTKLGMNVDEASKIKNHGAIRSQRVVDIGKGAAYRHISTGTPISHGPMDLYMEFEFLDPNIIGVGDFYSFRNRYAVMGGFEGRQIVGYQNLDELIEIVAPFVFQVKKEHVAKDLPPKSYQVRTIKMPAEQRTLYDRVKREVEVELADGAINVDNTLVKLLRLSEITSGYYVTEKLDEDGNKVRTRHRFKEDPKTLELLNILEDTDQSAIIWCPFRDQLDRVVTALRKEYGPDCLVEFHGGIPKDEREEAKQKFQTGQARFFVGNAATGGLGLNLQRGTLMVYMGNTFNSIDREQSEDRFYRIGQLKPTTVVDILAEKTFDHKVMDNLKMKKDISTYVAEQIRAGKPIL